MELSQKLKLVLFSTSSCFINLNNNYPLNELLFICSDEEKDRLLNLNIEEKSGKVEKSAEAPNIFRFLYFNMKVFHQILFENDAVIKIEAKKADFQKEIDDKANFDEKFINYFYLAKLIEDKNEILNYKYINR